MSTFTRSAATVARRVTAGAATAVLVLGLGAGAAQAAPSAAPTSGEQSADVVVQPLRDTGWDFASKPVTKPAPKPADTGWDVVALRGDTGWDFI